MDTSSTEQRQGRQKCLHGQKDITMLAKRLAACTRLATTVSQLFEPQLQKISPVRALTVDF